MLYNSGVHNDNNITKIMKLKLTPDLKNALRGQLASIILDVMLDGSLDTPDVTATALETLAAEIRKQNVNG
jgi:hypothetical protein